MAQYSTGIITKERIINACKILFYNKGYKDTTFKDICKSAQVHPGSIGHHFGSKKNIASQIYGEIMEYICKRMPQLFPHEDELTLLILQLCVHQKMILDDVSYRKFSLEFDTEFFTIEDMSQYKSFFSNIYSFTTKKMDEKKVGFYFAAYIGMDKVLQPYIDMHIDSLTFEDVVRYTNEIYYSFLPKDELNKGVERALELIKMIKIDNDNLDIYIELKR